MRENSRDVDAHALLDVDQNLIVPGFVTHQKQPESVVLHDFERLARDVGLRVARPVQSQLAQAARNFFRARQVIRECVVIKKEFAHLRKIFLRQSHFRGDIFRTARAVTMSAERLRPQAECALGPAAPPRIERHIRMLQIPDEIILYRQIALVHVHDIGKVIHVLYRGTRRREA